MNMSLEEFVLKYQYCVKYWVSYYSPLAHAYGIDIDDLYQEGCLGLAKRYSQYDSSKAAPNTYAYIVTKTSIYHYIQEHRTPVHFPMNLLLLSISLSNQRSDFYKLNGRDMTITEMLDFIKKSGYCSTYRIDMEFLKTILALEKYYSNGCNVFLDAISINFEYSNANYNYDSEDTLDEIDTLMDNYNLEDDIVLWDEVNRILSYIKTHFEQKDFDIFLERLGFIDGIPKTTRTLANKYDISFQAINQRYHKVLKKTQEKFNN